MTKQLHPHIPAAARGGLWTCPQIKQPQSCVPLGTATLKTFLLHGKGVFAAEFALFGVRWEQTEQFGNCGAPPAPPAALVYNVSAQESSHEHPGMSNFRAAPAENEVLF